jgi:hypothetical protein
VVLNGGPGVFGITKKKHFVFSVFGFSGRGIWRKAAKEGFRTNNQAAEDQEFGCDILCPT